MSDGDSVPSPIEEAILALGGRLAGLPESKFLSAIALLDPAASRPAVAAVLDEARPRLRALRPQRPLTVLRLICDPFEDLLAFDSVDGDDGSRIPRRAIAPLWKSLAERDPSGLAPLEAALKQLRAGDHQAIAALAERIWRWAAALLTKGLPVPAGLDGAYRLMHDAIESAPVIEAFKRAVPTKPLPSIDEAVERRIRNGRERLRQEGKRPDVYVLVIAARLVSPSDLFAVLDRDGGRPAALAARLDRLALDMVTDRAAHFKKVARDLDPEDLAHDADELIRTLRATVHAVAPGVRDTLEGRTSGLAEAVGAILGERVVAPAVGAVAGVLGGPVSGEQQAAAEAAARALHRCHRIAPLLGIGAAADAAVAEIHRRCRSRMAACLPLAQPALDAADPARDEAMAALYSSIRMIELVEGQQAALPFLMEARRRLRPAS